MTHEINTDAAAARAAAFAAASRETIVKTVVQPGAAAEAAAPVAAASVSEKNNVWTLKISLIHFLQVNFAHRCMSRSFCSSFFETIQKYVFHNFWPLDAEIGHFRPDHRIPLPKVPM